MYFFDIGQYFHLVTKKMGTQTTTTTTGRQTELPTDRHFLDLSEMCLYNDHFGLSHFFSKIAKNCLHKFNIKVNKNMYV